MKNVFISSTFTDLEDHRNFVREGVRQLGLVDLSMENFGARDERPKDECIRMISEESDYFVGIYAHKYGYIPDGGGKSMTEAEYEAATISNLPRFIYVVDEGHPWPPKQIDDGAEKKKLNSLKSRLLKRHMCRKFTSGENLTSSVVADLGKYIAIKNVPRVGPEIALTDIGIDSLRGPVEDTPDEWNKLRNGIYNDNRGVFLTHVISPSDKLNQEFDIFIYLMRHQSDDLSDIRFAEFFLGKYWNNRIFPAVLQNGFIGITTAAFGTFLCLCKITFNDGEERLISRYIDFESHRQGS